MGNFLNYIPYFPEFLEDYNLTFIHEPFEFSYWIVITMKW